MSDNQKLHQTLFICDSDYGFYALNSFVDVKTNTLRLKTLGPLLVDGISQIADRVSSLESILFSSFKDPNVLQPRLPEEIDLQVSVYQTTSGEFLLLGNWNG